MAIDIIARALAASLEDEIKQAISGAYKVCGNITFSELPPAAGNNLGYIYNITDAFTTTGDFIEGAGHSYPANTTVGIVLRGNGYHYDIFESFFDISAYATKEDLNNKLDKHTAVDGLLVYGVNNGVQTMLGITTSGQSGSLVQLDSYGNLIISDPVEEQHAITIHYLTENLPTLLAENGGVATSNALGLVKSSEGTNAVQVNNDGTMSISAVDVSTLQQGEGEDIELNGGTAL